MYSPALVESLELHRCYALWSITAAFHYLMRISPTFINENHLLRIKMRSPFYVIISKGLVTFLCDSLGGFPSLAASLELSANCDP